MSDGGRKKGKAVVVGGSIAGVASAHALIRAGWEVVVVEKSIAPPTRSPTGAGLSLDTVSQKIVNSWLRQPHLLQTSTLPLSIDLNEATDGEKNIRWTLARDENLNFIAAHWADLHSLLYDALPPDIFLWGHLYLSFCISNDESNVKVKTKILQTGEIIEIVGDFLIAADGCLSSIRRSFLPEFKLRYSGYCAWRGVLNFSDNEHSEAMIGIREAYPDLGKCLYLNLGYRTHTVLFELLHKKINWIWYVNQPEPELERNSVTTKVSSNMIKEMYEEAEKVWVPEMVKLMKETKEPFINVIYDCDPLEQIVWDNVVLVGDAAHPITPHSSRSTNMAILDAAVLGKCLEKQVAENLHSALGEFQSIRLPVVSKQVLHSRYVGRIKQGLVLSDRNPFDPMIAKPEECQILLQRSVPFLGDAPSILP
ncbi:uncharacterized protein LOC114264928 [Camellia sinensis]|uniref:uncharacterized protein LOC114264928 n=1 Tax=Camellia sinensis TaxID=4442 RepID=UPI001036DA6F|nr:uncharacterized protein LOC114264928 [Camellia sinensis]